jgi:hypothetical protein
LKNHGGEPGIADSKKYNFFSRQRYFAANFANKIRFLLVVEPVQEERVLIPD